MESASDVIRRFDTDFGDANAARSSVIKTSDLEKDEQNQLINKVNANALTVATAIASCKQW